MKNIILKSLMLGLLSTNVLGAPSKLIPFNPQTCQSIDNTEKYFENIYQATSQSFLSCEDVKEFTRVIKRIDSISSITPKLSLITKPKYPQASFDMGEIIRIPLILTFISQWGHEYRNYNNSSSITLAHEYGHAIFSKKVQKDSKLQNINKFRREMSSLEVEIQKEKNSLNRNYRIKQLIKEYERAKDKARNYSEANRYHRISSPYSELFGDLVAALIYDDKSIMVKALYYDEMSDQDFELIQARDFGMNSLTMNGRYMSEEHGMMAPTRRFIGQNLWPTNTEEKRKLLENLLDLCIKEVNRYLDQGLEHPKSAEFNKVLINKLKSKYNMN